MHCGDIEGGGSVNDSNLDSRVIWLVKACDAGIFFEVKVEYLDLIGPGN